MPGVLSVHDFEDSDRQWAGVSAYRVQESVGNEDIEGASLRRCVRAGRD